MFGISMLSGNCLPLSSSLNKFKLFFFFHEGKVVIQKMLIPCQMEKVIFVLSIQVAKSTDVYRVLTVCRGLERAFNANFKILNVTLERKWEVEPWVAGKLSHCFSCTLCVNGTCSLTRPGAPSLHVPMSPTACTLPVWFPSHLAPLHRPHCPCTILTAPAPSSLPLHQGGPHDTTMALEQDPSHGPPCLESLVPSHHPPPCHQSDLFSMKMTRGCPWPSGDALGRVTASSSLLS